MGSIYPSFQHKNSKRSTWEMSAASPPCWTYSLKQHWPQVLVRNKSPPKVVPKNVLDQTLRRPMCVIIESSHKFFEKNGQHSPCFLLYLRTNNPPKSLSSRMETISWTKPLSCENGENFARPVPLHSVTLRTRIEKTKRVEKNGQQFPPLFNTKIWETDWYQN